MLNIDAFLSNIAFIRTLGLTAMPIVGSEDDVVVDLTVAGHSYRILGVAPSGLELVLEFWPWIIIHGY